MTTWTISTGDGRTITSSKQVELREAVSEWFPAMPGQATAHMLKLLFDSIRRGHVHNAGSAAHLLNLNLAWAASSNHYTTTTDSPDLGIAAGSQLYSVPIDPASLTDCEACQ